MINLLPIVDKREIMAGRTNRVLLRYIIFSLVTLGLVLLLIIGTYGFLMTQKMSAEQQIRDNDTRAAELSREKKEIDEFTKNLTATKQILSKRINYTSGVLRIAQLMPSGVILESLTLAPTVTTEPQLLAIRAKSESAAVAFKDALNSSGYFSDVKFESITLTESEDGETHPYTVNMTATVKKELFNEQ